MDVQLEKKRFSNQKLLIIGGIVLLIALIVYVIVQTSGGSKLNVETERISINTVKKDIFQENIPVNGIVLPITTIYTPTAKKCKIKPLTPCHSRQ